MIMTIQEYQLCFRPIPTGIELFWMLNEFYVIFFILTLEQIIIANIFPKYYMSQNTTELVLNEIQITIRK